MPVNVDCYGNNSYILLSARTDYVLLRCYGFITRKNMIAMLVSLELMLNAVDINFVVFNRFLYPEQMEGMFFTLFAIAIAAAETALAIAIIINIFRAAKSIDVRSLNEMKF